MPQFVIGEHRDIFFADYERVKKLADQGLAVIFNADDMYKAWDKAEHMVRYWYPGQELVFNSATKNIFVPAENNMFSFVLTMKKLRDPSVPNS